MNLERISQYRLTLIPVLWLSVVMLINYLTFWGETQFAPLAQGQSGMTSILHKAGWPIAYCEQRHSRKPMPKIEHTFNIAATVFNLAIILLVQLAVQYLVARFPKLTIRLMLLLTACAAVVASLATTSNAQFGGSILQYALLYSFALPVPLACIMLLIDTAPKILKYKSRSDDAINAQDLG